MMADYFGVTTEFLSGAVSSFNNGKNGSGVAIPLLAKVAYGLPVSQNEVIGEEIIPEKLASGGDYFALRMNDDTMAPYILKFDRLIVRVDPNIDAWGYDKVALVHEGKASAFCANIRSAENGTWIIYNNPVYGAQFWEKGSMEFAIVGEVVEIRRTL
jgi:SOS-response transcriptional repressor LexA